MHTARHRPLVALLGALLCSATLGACQRPSALTGVDPLATERALCLAPMPDDTAGARQLATAQAAAVRRPDDVRPWLATGEAWLSLARRAPDAGHGAGAAACGALALDVAPGDAAARRLELRVLLDQHRFAAARERAEALLARESDDPAALAALADATLELGDYAAAHEATQRLLAARPGMAANSRAAWLRWLQGDVEGAKRAMRDALQDRDERQPEAAAWAFAETAALYWHVGDFDGAAQLYFEALRWQADAPDALLGQARVALARGDAGAALWWVERAPSSVVQLMLRGDAHVLAGEYEAAQRAYSAAEALGRRGDRLGLAMLLLRREGERSWASPALQTAGDPALLPLLQGEGRGEDGVGPGAPERMTKRAEEALRLLAQERQLRDGIALDDLEAWALYHAGRFDDARVASDRARRLGTRDAALLYHAGAIRLAQGEDDGGRALLREALALNPAFDVHGAAHARALLASPATATTSRVASAGSAP